MSKLSLVFLSLFSLSGCAFVHSEADQMQKKEEASITEKESNLIIIEIKRLTPGEGSKYLWSKVKVVKVVEADASMSSIQSGDILDVAYKSFGPEIPSGVSTVVLSNFGTDSEKYRVVEILTSK